MSLFANRIVLLDVLAGNFLATLDWDKETKRLQTPPNNTSKNPVQRMSVELFKQNFSKLLQYRQIKDAEDKMKKQSSRLLSCQTQAKSYTFTQYAVAFHSAEQPLLVAPRNATFICFLFPEEYRQVVSFSNVIERVRQSNPESHIEEAYLNNIC